MTTTGTTFADIANETEALAVRCDERGDTAAAATIRAEWVRLTAAQAARKVLAMRCDNCNRVVAGHARIARYTETLGLDWVHCATCATST